MDTRTDAYKTFLGVGTPATDPCNGETFAGRCNGTSVVWCENQQVKTSNCSAQNKVCGFSAEKQYYGCIEPAQADPCNGETYAGRCDGNKVDLVREPDGQEPDLLERVRLQHQPGLLRLPVSGEADETLQNEKLEVVCSLSVPLMLPPSSFRSICRGPESSLATGCPTSARKSIVPFMSTFM